MAFLGAILMKGRDWKCVVMLMKDLVVRGGGCSGWSVALSTSLDIY